uniref:Dehydrogenase/reductase SDR family member 4 n=1 Tax=Heterorhabditis bacteriophora TaxID=37862 RepID=A0A1I7XLU0_HETBA
MSTCRRFEGKVAIITAATKGIGLSIAERLGQEGASVVICSRNRKNVDEAVQYLNDKGISKAGGVVCHIANPKDQKNLVDYTISQYGRIDILVNNHGINPTFGHILGKNSFIVNYISDNRYPLFLDVDDKIWDKLFEVNVKAGWQMTKLVYPHMVKNGGGSIIFNASYSAYKNPPGIAAYAVTKTTLVGLTKALANELSKDNIRVNGIAPGIIKTKMSQMLWDGNGDEGERNLVAEHEIQLGRLGVPEDCAGAVAFLASSDANYITGEVIVIAGGIHARL